MSRHEDNVGKIGNAPAFVYMFLEKQIEFSPPLTAAGDEKGAVQIQQVDGVLRPIDLSGTQG